MCTNCCVRADSSVDSDSLAADNQGLNLNHPDQLTSLWTVLLTGLLQSSRAMPGLVLFACLLIAGGADRAFGLSSNPKLPMSLLPSILPIKHKILPPAILPDILLWHVMHAGLS